MKSTFVRAAEFSIRDDGRTLDGCLVPYGQVADVVELDDDTQQLVRYQEQFLPHSLAAMAQGFQARGGKTASSHFIPLLIDHNDKFDNMIGHAVELRDEDDGAYGSFRLYDSADIVKIRSVLTESHTGLSVAFRDVRAPKMVDGIISRVQVFVGHVAATPVPAYQGAGITALRSAEPVDELIHPKLDDVKAWLAEQTRAKADG
jgi:HK97 family phage prohead protease